MNNTNKNAPADVGASLAGARSNNQVQDTSRKGICQIRNLTERESALLGMLVKATKQTAITRERIRNTFHVSDRTCRDMIVHIRKNGYRIVTDSKNGGYWIAKSESEYQKFRPHYVAYAEDIMDTAEKMDNEGQVSINDLL